ncbi:MAG: hypothetical protein CMO80_07335 [Verrucomicrobiales bacterium]|nr:hypothetical protein [Verrucomicrobiales bacterium]|tara:strand:- start:3504 stop:4964 length:1461 start_codon:yes stop_codon:yes gene_type:complete
MTADPHDETNAGPSATGARFNVMLGTISLIAIVVMVNYIASRHPIKWSISADRYQPLSPVTLQILKSVSEEVNVIIYFDPSSPLFGHVQSLLHQYHEVNPKIAIEEVDYVTEPARAEAIKTEHGLGPSMRDLIIFTHKGRTRIVRHSQLAEYDSEELLKTRTVKRKEFTGEAHFTTALLAVHDAKKRVAGYLIDHGEHGSGMDRENDYGQFLKLLQDHNVSVGNVRLAGLKEIPDELQLLIVAGSDAKISEENQAKLHRYLESGGRMLVLFRYRGRSELERLMDRWGVEVQNRRVVDPTQQNQQAVAAYPEVAHETVRALTQRQMGIAMALPRPVRAKDGNKTADAPQVVELAKTTKQGIAVVDYENGLRYDERTDETGAIPLIAAVEKGSIMGVSEGSTRMIVVGDSHCFDNFMLPQGGNRDFAWNAVSWLLDQSELIGITPQPIREYRFSMTAKQLQTVQWIFLAGIPGGVLFLGWIVWLRRQM